MPGLRTKTVFVCDSCGNESARWEGRCPACSEWNTLAEVSRRDQDSRRKSRPKNLGASPQQLTQVSSKDAPRLSVASPEVNRVLGGGIVSGSLTLVAGDPGIGKSTLLLRIASDLSQLGNATLYVSGEESAAQIKMRAERLGLPCENLYVLTTTNISEVLDALDSSAPSLVIIDSIQTIHDDSLSSGAGSVAQIRECTRQLMEWAKSNSVPIFLSGHVTKVGEIAGPRVLEHMVDVVLYMEGDPVSSWRVLKTIKNRFGSTNEVGVFEMTASGLLDVEDPSKALLAERAGGSIGSVIIPTMEGSRPLLVEVQALTSPTALPTPRRVATGFDHNRLLLVCAVLSRRAGIPLSSQDVIVNVAGGFRINEPAADLGLALAIASSLRNVPINGSLAAIGELGLSGEVRRVPQIDRRVSELARLGFSRCLVPGVSNAKTSDIADLEPVAVSTLAEAIAACIPRDISKAINRA